MKSRLGRVLLCLVPAGLPALLFAFSGGPPARRTATPVDGGLDCSACHRTFAPANSDPAGSLKIEASDYAPGVKQTIRVTIAHPTAQRWGFQLTARLVADQTKMAGSFTASDTVQIRCVAFTAAANNQGSFTCADGDLQFAEHNAASTRLGTPNGVTFEVDWNPPPTESGRVMLYAAGNAADGNGNNQNDRIYTTKLEVKAQNLCNLSARPTVRAVLNSLSNDNRLSPNGLFSIYGTNLGAPGLKRSFTLGDLDDNGRVPTALGCVAVEIGGQLAPITYVQQDQINAQVPTGLSGSGPVQVTVITNPGRNNSTRSDVASGVLVQTYAPALVIIPGTKYAVATSIDGRDIIADPAAVPGTRAARPGETIVLYGTGFGFTKTVWQAGEIPDAPSSLPDGALGVTIGGSTLAASDIVYGGLAPTLISGAYQFNLKLPQTVGTGDVPIRMSIGGQNTQSDAVIRVATP